MRMTVKEYTLLVRSENRPRPRVTRRTVLNDFGGLRETVREDPWWFAEGLRFKCLGCGRCCRGEAGGIFLRPGDERRLAEFFDLSIDELRRRFETQRWRFPSLKECSGGACVMLDDRREYSLTYERARCKIYAVRPIHCRTWPFWPQLLESPDAWKAAARRCPGMDCGELWSGERIAKILRAHENFMKELQDTGR